MSFHLIVISYCMSFTQSTIRSENNYAVECFISRFPRSEPEKVIVVKKIKNCLLIIVNGKKRLKKPKNKPHAQFPNVYPLVAWRLFLSISYNTQIGINSSELQQSLLCIPQSCVDVSPCFCHTPLTTKLDHGLKNCFGYREVCEKNEGT